MARIIYVLVLSVVFNMGKGVHPFEEDYIMTFTDNSRVFATAGKTSGTYQIRYPSNIIENYTVNPFGHSTVSVNNNVFLNSGTERKTVIVRVENSRTLQIRARIGNSILTPIPVSALGKRYIVTSCIPNWIPRYTGILVIATHSLPADITITFKTAGSLTYDGQTYNECDILQVRLGEYQTFTLKNIPHDITGSVVEATQSVAVFSGNTRDQYIYGYEQMIPVIHLGHEFIFALKIYYDVVKLKVVTQYHNTRLTFNDGVEAVLDSYTQFERSFRLNGTSLYFTSSHPVQCTLYNSRAFMNVVPVSLLPRQAIFHPNFETDIFIMTRIPNNVTVQDSVDSDLTVRWNNIANSDYKIASFRNDYKSILVKSTSTMSVIGFTFWQWAFTGGYDFSGQADDNGISTIHYESMNWNIMKLHPPRILLI